MNDVIYYVSNGVGPSLEVGPKESRKEKWLAF